MKTITDMIIIVFLFVSMIGFYCVLTDNGE